MPFLGIVENEMGLFSSFFLLLLNVRFFNFCLFPWKMRKIMEV
uniref:Uncharacterized protein n=1 Tax=Rhizophora mucronata TaxID=61149 RepID=A0A2P2IQP2_RHIMU